jgi:hypothetical protein
MAEGNANAAAAPSPSAAPSFSRLTLAGAALAAQGRWALCAATESLPRVPVRVYDPYDTVAALSACRAARNFDLGREPATPRTCTGCFSIGAPMQSQRRHAQLLLALRACPHLLHRRTNAKPMNSSIKRESVFTSSTPATASSSRTVCGWRRGAVRRRCSLTCGWRHGEATLLAAGERGGSRWMEEEEGASQSQAETVQDQGSKTAKDQIPKIAKNVTQVRKQTSLQALTRICVHLN